ncbi:MAG: NAD(P)/FAD-dependent oxidoreductase [Thiobacillaceae bacterium]|jgi:thioredoxin reductase|nr:NAD(P)/FAD-dependent oxidoreductase [Thiobacillaceae bacterium]
MSGAAMRVAILGAGPAGMSCANACLSFGLEPVVVERADHVGGAQRSNFHPNLWLLGAPEESGEAMTQRMAAHFLDLPLTLRTGVEVTALARADGAFRLRLATPEGEREEVVQAVVLAMGMRPRATPELEALAARSPRVIIGPLSDTIRDGIRGARVLILGGGDNAADHALFLAERGNTARVCARAAFSARRSMLDACAEREEIELRDHCVPDRVEVGADALRVSWGRVTVRYDWLLVMYGYRPNTDALDRFEPDLRPALTAGGHVRVDGWQRTSVAGLYAAGDLTDSVQPSVATAIAQGLAAARAIERDSRGR